MSAETKTIRILTADDHALLRQGIASLVEIEPDMELVAQASTGARRSSSSGGTSRTSPSWICRCPISAASRRSSPSAANSPMPGSSS